MKFLSICSIMIVVASTCSVALSQEGERVNEEAREAKRLYLHWIKSANAGSKAPSHMLSQAIYPNEAFEVAFSDPSMRERVFRIEGRIDRKVGKYVGKAKVLWLSGTTFTGAFHLEQPKEGKVLGYSGAYFDSILVLSHESSSQELMKALDGRGDKRSADEEKPAPKQVGRKSGL